MATKEQKGFLSPPRSRRTVKSHYKVCEYCGAYLDPGERHHCQEKTSAAPEQKEKA